MLILAMLLAGAEAEIDELFDAALQAEKSGDCAAAGERYKAILVFADTLQNGDGVRSLAQSRLVRTEACRVSCEVTDADLLAFQTAKEAVNQPKRVAELCQQILNGKDAKCKGYAEIRAWCP